MQLHTYLLHPITLAVIAGILTLLLIKMDCVVSKKEKTTADYCKNIFVVSGIVASAVYLVQRFGGGSSKSHGGAIVEEIHLGEPDF